MSENGVASFGYFSVVLGDTVFGRPAAGLNLWLVRRGETPPKAEAGNWRCWVRKCECGE